MRGERIQWAGHLRKRLQKALLLSVAALEVFSESAMAQVAWNGTTSNDWTDGANWAGGVAPAPGTAVNINTASPNPVLGVSGAAAGTTGNIAIGAGVGSTGNLTIQNASTLTSSGANVRLGQAAGSSGTATVTGAGSQWLVTNGQLVVGFGGSGILNIQNGGTVSVSAASGTRVGAGGVSSGTLYITGGSTLETRVLSGNGVGASQANFDSGILKATGNNATFINGFVGTELNILAGGLTIDTAGFTVGSDAASGFNGTGGLTVTGGGVFSLLANSPYLGETWVQGGSTLALQGAGAIAASSRVIADGTFDLTAATTPTIKSLAGSGAVNLGTRTLTITDANDLFAGIISGTGELTVEGGTQTLSGANSYTGATNVTGGTLRAGGANIVSTSSAFNIASGGTFDLSGFDQTLTTLSNAGLVNFGGAPGTTITVTGDYTGASGLLNLNTSLQGDAAPTDRLVVQGNTAGNTSVKVTNSGGAGAPTVEGIKIIDVAGTSAGIFALQGDYVFHSEQAVIGGAYAYTLHKNGVSTPADGDWYLRSALVNQPAVVPPGPIYQPGVALYESFPQILLKLMSMPTMRDRIGDRYASADVIAATASPGTDDDGMSYLGGPPQQSYDSSSSYRDKPNVWWARVDASRVSIEPSASTAAATYDADQVRLQTGFDALLFTDLLTDLPGRLMGGFTVQQGMSSAHVQSVWSDGKLRTDGIGIGGTLTWHGNNGVYMDSQAQVNWFDTDIGSSLAGAMKDGENAVGYGVSVETGKRFAAGGSWSLTPQAQLSYTNADMNFLDNFGASVSSEDGDSLLGRLGLALDFRMVTGATRSNIYAIANLQYELLDGTSVDVAGVTFRSETDQVWGGLGVGGSYSWAADKYALFSEVSVNTGLDNFGDSHSVNGTAGFRTRW